MAITVLKNNAPWGPFTRAQIEDGLQRGDFTLKYLAYAPGLKEWLPLGEVLHVLDVGTKLPPVPSTLDLPPVPGSKGPLMPAVHPPALPTGTVSTKVSAPIVSAPSLPELRYASFLPRLVAFVIDCAILFVPVMLLFSLGSLIIEVRGWWEQTDQESMHQEWALWHRNFVHLLMLVAIGVGWLYAAGLEASRWQATIGKQWMGIKVTDSQGERLGFLQSTGRHAAKFLSALPCFLGFIVALFSSRGLTLHDRLAKTRVVRD